MNDSKDLDRQIKMLLALNTLAEQRIFLQAENLMNAASMNALLRYAEQNWGHLPSAMQQLLAIITALAPSANLPAFAPQAQYLNARIYTVQGDFVAARQLIEAARDSYLAVGQAQEAARVTVGLMMVWGKLGALTEAIAAADAALQQLDETEAADQAIAAKLYHNRGICQRRLGQYTAALDSFQAAELHYQAVGMTEARLANDRGVISLMLGRCDAALTVFNEMLNQWEVIQEQWSAAERPLIYGNLLGNVGYAYLQSGEYAQSLTFLQQARAHQQAATLMDDLSTTLIDLADAYYAVNLYSEAEEMYATAVVHLENSHTPYDQARAYWGWGLTLAAQHNYETATTKLQQAHNLFKLIGNIPLQTHVQLALAEVAAAQGSPQIAEAQIIAAQIQLHEQTAPLQKFYAALLLANLKLADNQLSAATAALEKAQLFLEQFDIAPLRYRINAAWGQLYRKQNNFDAAESHLLDAIQDIESLRGTLVQDSFRTAYLADKVPVYSDLIALYLDANQIEAAFSIAEQAKSRTLIEVMAGVIDRQQAALPTADAQQLQQLQRDLSLLYNQLLHDQEDERRGRHPLRQILHQATALEQQLANFERERAQHQGDAPTMMAALPFSTLVPELAEATTLLVYHIIGDEILAFLYTAGELHVTRKLASLTAVQRLHQKLEVQWRRLNIGQKLSQRHMQQLEHSARHVLGELYGALVAPIREMLGSAQLTIIPHGVLHHIPFHALFDGERYLIDDFVISYAPSVTVFSFCQKRSMRKPAQTVIFGVSDVGLTAVAAETEMIAKQYPHAKQYQEQQATIAQFQASAPQANILHVACHAIFRTDNPAFSALKLYDGWLSAFEIIRLNLPHSFVTLSACESGVSQISSGDEIIGLARAFLGAGAATLVVSLWLVEDRVAAEFMPSLYRFLDTGASRASALRQAQLAIRDQYPHPFHWAAFMLIGKN